MKDQTVGWLVFILAKKYFSHSTAIFAITFLAISPFSISYSQEARMYSLMMTLALWSLYWNMEFYKGRINKFIPILIFAGEIAFLYSHGSGFLLFSSLSSFFVIAWLYGNAMERKNLLTLVTIMFLVIILSIPIFLHSKNIFVGHTLSPNFSNVISNISDLFIGVNGDRYLLIRVLGFLLFLISSFSILLNRKSASSFIVLSYALVPIICSIIISQFDRPIWLFRTIAFTTPFWFLLLGHCCNQLFHIKKVYAISLTITISFLLLVSTILYYDNRTGEKDFQKAVSFVKNNSHAGDVVFINSERLFWGWCWYYPGVGGINPLKDNKEIIAPDGVILINTSDLSNSDKDYWIISRSSFNTAGIINSEKLQVEVFQFDDLFVTRVQNPDLYYGGVKENQMFHNILSFQS